VGELISRDRRGLTLQVTAQLTPASARLLGTCSFDWWSNSINGRSHSITLAYGTDEYFKCDEAYVQSIAVQVPEGNLGTISFTIQGWVFQRVNGTSIPKDHKGFDPYKPEHQPIPHWACSMSSPVPGTPLSYNVNVNNNFQFWQLCEATVRPPTPRMVFPGPLTCDVGITTIAPTGSIPPESGGIDFTLGNSTRVGLWTAAETKYHIPFAVRDPNYAYQSIADPNGLIKLQSSYKALGLSPTLA
jgi:hypothetical protein